MLSEAVKLLVSRRDNGAGRLFQTRGPATAKLLSSNWVLVRGTTHVRASADRRRRPTSATNRQSSESTAARDRVESCTREL